MYLQGIAPTFEHAEVHTAYLPHPENPHLAEARRVAEQINAVKVSDPSTGARIYDGLVDSLVENTIAVARQHEHAPEPADWTCPQRCVWRFSTLPYEQRYEIVQDRTVASGVKAYASVNGGKWLITCPFPGCSGAQYASFHDRRFWCVDCNSKAVSGKWIEVVWPEDHLAVESWLSNRPQTAKHWFPGETATDIAEQDKVAFGKVNK